MNYVRGFAMLSFPYGYKNPSLGRYHTIPSGKRHSTPLTTLGELKGKKKKNPALFFVGAII